jgi:hypothetical protein
MTSQRKPDRKSQNTFVKYDDTQGVQEKAKLLERLNGNSDIEIVDELSFDVSQRKMSTLKEDSFVKEYRFMFSGIAGPERNAIKKAAKKVIISCLSKALIR